MFFLMGRRGRGRSAFSQVSKTGGEFFGSCRALNVKTLSRNSHLMGFRWRRVRVVDTQERELTERLLSGRLTNKKIEHAKKKNSPLGGGGLSSPNRTLLADAKVEKVILHLGGGNFLESVHRKALWKGNSIRGGGSSNFRAKSAMAQNSRGRNYA